MDFQRKDALILGYLCAKYFCAPKEISTNTGFGGGGGAYGFKSDSGHGGGITGLDGGVQSFAFATNSYILPGQKGTQTEGGFGQRYGGFGYGGNGASFASSGGGGGWYGGGSSYALSGGGGGSGFINLESNFNPACTVLSHFALGDSDYEDYIKNDGISDSEETNEVIEASEDNEAPEIAQDLSFEGLKNAYIKSIVDAGETISELKIGVQQGTGKVIISGILYNDDDVPVIVSEEYTESGMHYFTTPGRGFLKLECFGAQGGSFSGYTNLGGWGGYARGGFYFEKGTLLSICVGQYGLFSSKYERSFGGGGHGAGDYGNGGGFSAIYINEISEGVYEEVPTWSSNLDKRIIVGGGGGAGVPYSEPEGFGGDGTGGLAGGSYGDAGWGSGGWPDGSASGNTDKIKVLVSDLTVCRITLKCDASLDIPDGARISIDLYMDGEVITTVVIKPEAGFGTYVNEFHFDTILPPNTPPFYAYFMATITSNTPIIVPDKGLNLYFYTKTRSNDEIIGKEYSKALIYNIYVEAINFFKFIETVLPTFNFVSNLMLKDFYIYKKGEGFDSYSIVDIFTRLSDSMFEKSYGKILYRLFEDSLNLFFGKIEAEKLKKGPVDTLFLDFVSGIKNYIGYIMYLADLRPTDTKFLDYLKLIEHDLSLLEAGTEEYEEFLDYLKKLSDSVDIKSLGKLEKKNKKSGFGMKTILSFKKGD